MVAIVGDQNRAGSGDPADAKGEISGLDWLAVLLFALVAFTWIANGSGLLSSNDGSHLALARALSLRGETTIEAERALTLEVDLAEREGRAYSDRPPGTAFASLAAARVGDRLDLVMRDRAIGQARAGRAVDPLPGARPYLMTYAKRARPGSPRLVALIGTSISIGVHAAMVGLLGLVLVSRLAAQLGLGPGARLFALACLALASGWGPYSTALFSHVHAATCVAGFALGVVTIEADEQRQTARAWVSAATGLAGCWAIACDYLLIVAIVPAALATIPPRRYLPVLAGALPIAAATLAYHDAAFGSPLAIGYDHQTNFAFARARGSTFSGAWLEGLWTLWGAGRGAGILVQAPIVLIGVAGCVALASAPVSERGRVVWPRLLLAFALWAAIVAKHRTPWGGGTEDYRYLVPMLPLAGVGLAWAWERGRTWALRGALVVLALGSAALTWRHFWAWHEGEPFARVELGLALAAVVLAAGLAAVFIGRKLRPAPLSC